jgi:hypothetical protein
MANMWTFSPTLMVIIGTVACFMLLWGQIWGDKQNKTGEKYTCPVFLVFRCGFLTAMAFIGIVLLDGAVRLCVQDLLSYGSFKYILAAVILCTGLGIFLIIGAVFIAPTWKSIVSFGVMFVIALIIAVLSYSEANIEYTDFLIVPPCIGIGVNLILNITELIYLAFTRKTRSEKSTEKSTKNTLPSKIGFKQLQQILSPPLWDVSNRFKKIINTKVYIIILIVFATELILLFEGMTYFVWI